MPDSDFWSSDEDEDENENAAAARRLHIQFRRMRSRSKSPFDIDALMQKVPMFAGMKYSVAVESKAVSLKDDDDDAISVLTTASTGELNDEGELERKNVDPESSPSFISKKETDEREPAESEPSHAHDVDSSSSSSSTNSAPTSPPNTLSAKGCEIVSSHQVRASSVKEAQDCIERVNSKSLSNESPQMAETSENAISTSSSSLDSCESKPRTPRTSQHEINFKTRDASADPLSPSDSTCSPKASDPTSRVMDSTMLEVSESSSSNSNAPHAPCTPTPSEFLPSVKKSSDIREASPNSSSAPESVSLCTTSVSCVPQIAKPFDSSRLQFTPLPNASAVSRKKSSCTTPWPRHSPSPSPVAENASTESNTPLPNTSGAAAQTNSCACATPWPQPSPSPSPPHRLPRHAPFSVAKTPGSNVGRSGDVNDFTRSLRSPSVMPSLGPPTCLRGSKDQPLAGKHAEFTPIASQSNESSRKTRLSDFPRSPSVFPSPAPPAALEMKTPVSAYRKTSDFTPIPRVEANSSLHATPGIQQRSVTTCTVEQTPAFKRHFERNVDEKKHDTKEDGEWVLGHVEKFTAVIVESNFPRAHVEDSGPLSIGLPACDSLSTDSAGGVAKSQGTTRTFGTHTNRSRSPMARVSISRGSHEAKSQATSNGAVISQGPSQSVHTAAPNSVRPKIHPDTDMGASLVASTSQVSSHVPGISQPPQGGGVSSESLNIIRRVQVVKDEAVARSSHTQTPARGSVDGVPMEQSPFAAPACNSGTASNPILIPETPVGIGAASKVSACRVDASQEDTSSVQVSDSVVKDEAVARNSQTQPPARSSVDGVPVEAPGTNGVVCESVSMKDEAPSSAIDRSESTPVVSQTPAKGQPHSTAPGTAGNPVVIPPTPPVQTPKIHAPNTFFAKLPPPPPVPTPIAKLHKPAAPRQNTPLSANAPLGSQKAEFRRKQSEDAVADSRPRSEDSLTGDWLTSSVMLPPPPPVPTPIAKLHKSAASGPCEDTRTPLSLSARMRRCIEAPDSSLGFLEAPLPHARSKPQMKTPPTPPVPTPLAKVHRPLAPRSSDSAPVDSLDGDSDQRALVRQLKAPPTPPVPTPLAKVHKSRAPFESDVVSVNQLGDSNLEPGVVPVSCANDFSSGDQSESQLCEPEKSIAEGHQKDSLSPSEKETPSQDRETYSKSAPIEESSPSAMSPKSSPMSTDKGPKTSPMSTCEGPKSSPVSKDRAPHGTFEAPRNEKTSAKPSVAEATPSTNSVDDFRRRSISLSLSIAPERKPRSRAQGQYRERSSTPPTCVYVSDRYVFSSRTPERVLDPTPEKFLPKLQSQSNAQRDRSVAPSRARSDFQKKFPSEVPTPAAMLKGVVVAPSEPSSSRSVSHPHRSPKQGLHEAPHRYPDREPPQPTPNAAAAATETALLSDRFVSAAKKHALPAPPASVESQASDVASPGHELRSNRIISEAKKNAARSSLVSTHADTRGTSRCESSDIAAAKHAVDNSPAHDAQWNDRNALSPASVLKVKRRISFSSARKAATKKRKVAEEKSAVLSSQENAETAIESVRNDSMESRACCADPRKRNVKQKPRQGRSRLSTLRVYKPGDAPSSFVPDTSDVDSENREVDESPHQPKSSQANGQSPESGLEIEKETSQSTPIEQLPCDASFDEIMDAEYSDDASDTDVETAPPGMPSSSLFHRNVPSTDPSELEQEQQLESPPKSAEENFQSGTQQESTPKVFGTDCGTVSPSPKPPKTTPHNLDTSDSVALSPSKNTSRASAEASFPSPPQTPLSPSNSSGASSVAPGDNGRNLPSRASSVSPIARVESPSKSPLRPQHESESSDNVESTQIESEAAPCSPSTSSASGNSAVTDIPHAVTPPSPEAVSSAPLSTDGVSYSPAHEETEDIHSSSPRASSVSENVENVASSPVDGLTPSEVEMKHDYGTPENTSDRTYVPDSIETASAEDSSPETSTPPRDQSTPVLKNKGKGRVRFADEKDDEHDEEKKEEHSPKRKRAKRKSKRQELVEVPFNSNPSTPCTVPRRYPKRRTRIKPLKYWEGEGIFFRVPLGGRRCEAVGVYRKETPPSTVRKGRNRKRRRSSVASDVSPSPSPLSSSPSLSPAFAVPQPKKKKKARQAKDRNLKAPRGDRPEKDSANTNDEENVHKGVSSARNIRRGRPKKRKNKWPVNGTKRGKRRNKVSS